MIELGGWCMGNEPIFNFTYCRPAGRNAKEQRRKMWRYVPKPTVPWTEWRAPQ